MRDIRVMYTMAGLLDSINAFGGTRMRGIIQEFERWTKAELDYLVEARHAATLGTVLNKPITPDGAFAKPSDMSTVLAAVKPFLA